MLLARLSSKNLYFPSPESIPVVDPSSEEYNVKSLVNPKKYFLSQIFILKNN